MTSKKSTSHRARQIAAIGVAILTLAVAAAGGLTWYHSYRVKQTHTQVNNFIHQLQNKNIKASVQTIDVGFWPWSNTTLHNINYVIEPIQGAISVKSIVLKDWSQNHVNVQVQDAKFAGAGPDPSHVMDFRKPLNIEINLTRHGRSVVLKKLMFDMQGRARLTAKGKFEVPSSTAKWASAEVDRASIHYIDHGLLKAARIKAEKSLPQGSSLIDRYTAVYRGVEKRYGQDQSKWPVGVRFALLVGAGEIDPKLSDVELNLSPGRPISMKTLVQLSFSKDSLPSLNFEVPSPSSITAS